MRASYNGNHLLKQLPIVQHGEVLNVYSYCYSSKLFKDWNLARFKTTEDYYNLSKELDSISEGLLNQLKTKASNRNR
jgi:hypothetical protein